jgi:nucleoid DNA-binding protein
LLFAFRYNGLGNPIAAGPLYPVFDWLLSLGIVGATNALRLLFVSLDFIPRLSRRLARLDSGIPPYRTAAPFCSKAPLPIQMKVFIQPTMGTLTKRELVERISNDTGLVQSQVFEVVQRTLNHIIDALAEGQTVELRNFGILEVRLAKPRVGRNPKQPGSSCVIPARAIVKFKSGKIMRQKVAKLSASMKRDSATK